MNLYPGSLVQLTSGPFGASDAWSGRASNWSGKGDVMVLEVRDRGELLVGFPHTDEVLHRYKANPVVFDPTTVVITVTNLWWQRCSLSTMWFTMNFSDVMSNLDQETKGVLADGVLYAGTTVFPFVYITSADLVSVVCDHEVARDRKTP